MSAGGPGVEQVPRGRPPGKLPMRPTMKNTTTWFLVVAAGLTAWAALVGSTGWAVAAGAITVTAAGISFASARAQQ